MSLRFCNRDSGRSVFTRVPTYTWGMDILGARPMGTLSRSQCFARDSIHILHMSTNNQCNLPPESGCWAQTKVVKCQLAPLGYCRAFLLKSSISPATDTLLHCGVAQRNWRRRAYQLNALTYCVLSLSILFYLYLLNKFLVLFHLISIVLDTIVLYIT